jgi:hypothetical protein
MSDGPLLARVLISAPNITAVHSASR